MSVSWRSGRPMQKSLMTAIAPRTDNRTLCSRLRPPHDAGEIGKRRLRRAPQCREIDADHAQTPPIAFRPFEIIQQGPDEIAAQLDSSRDRALRRRKVLAQIANPLVIMDDAIGADRILETSTVLGHVEIEIAVLLA
jgi:hypothetical protein